MLVVVFSHNLNFSEDDHNKKDRQELDQRDEVHFPEMIVPRSRVPLGPVLTLLVTSPNFSRGMLSLGGDGRNDGQLLHGVV